MGAWLLPHGKPRCTPNASGPVVRDREEERIIEGRQEDLFMLGTNHTEQEVPRAVTATDEEGRFVETANALSRALAMAVFRELMKRDTPLSIVEIAGRLSLEKEEVEEHVQRLLNAGLVTESRRGLRREKVYGTGISDIEIRFFGGKRPAKARKRTRRDLNHEAKRLERAERKRERQEAKIAKKRARS